MPHLNDPGFRPSGTASRPSPTASVSVTPLTLTAKCQEMPQRPHPGAVAGSQLTSVKGIPPPDGQKLMQQSDGAWARIWRPVMNHSAFGLVVAGVA